MPKIPVKKHKGRPYFYPWLEWFSQEQVIIRRGVHYVCQQNSMCVLIRIRSASLGLRVSVYPKHNGDIHMVPRGRR